MKRSLNLESITATENTITANVSVFGWEPYSIKGKKLDRARLVNHTRAYTLAKVDTAAAPVAIEIVPPEQYSAHAWRYYDGKTYTQIDLDSDKVHEVADVYALAVDYVLSCSNVHGAFPYDVERFNRYAEAVAPENSEILARDHAHWDNLENIENSIAQAFEKYIFVWGVGLFIVDNNQPRYVFRDRELYGTAWGASKGEAGALEVDVYLEMWGSKFDPPKLANKIVVHIPEAVTAYPLRDNIVGNVERRKEYDDEAADALKYAREDKKKTADALKYAREELKAYKAAMNA